jgi:5-formyltetrahydrofolate cyclo-ligase
MNKKELRKEYTLKRAALSEQAYAGMNQSILEQVQQLKIPAGKNIHIFLPISGKREVDTWPVISYLQQAPVSAKIIVPRSDFSTGTLSHISYQAEQTVLEKNAYGIEEPVEGESISPEQIDLVFVPLLIFDRAGYRLGYGKGFYDRFLSECRPDVQKIGLCMFEPLEVLPGTEAHDIRLDVCVTPGHIYFFV